MINARASRTTSVLLRPVVGSDGAAAAVAAGAAAGAGLVAGATDDDRGSGVLTASADITWAGTDAETRLSARSRPSQEKYPYGTPDMSNAPVSSAVTVSVTSSGVPRTSS